MITGWRFEHTYAALPPIFSAPAEPTAAGLQARRLALARIDTHLAEGRSVYVGQFLARDDFIDRLGVAARRRQAGFVEIILRVDESTLRRRLALRVERPERPEHLINAAFVSPDDAPELLDMIGQLVARRGSAHSVDATGSIGETLDLIRVVLGGDEYRPGRSDDL